MTALVTGGASKISIRLAEDLVKEGRNVVFLHSGNNLRFPSDLLKNSSFTLLNLSSVNEDAIRDIIEKLDIKTVFDGSLTTSDVTLEPLLAARKLLLGITSILDAIRKSSSPPELVLISGEDVYGTPKTRLENQPLEPVNFVGSAQMSVEAMVHSYAVSYRIPIVIARIPRVMIARRSEMDPKLTNLTVSGNLNFLEVSNAVDGLLKIEKLATSERPAEVYNISCFIHVLKKEPESRDVRMDITKITSETSWKARDLGNVAEVPLRSFECIQPVFLTFGADSELKTQFYELAKADGITLKESSILNLQEASDKSVLAEIDLVKPSHLVYFGNETESFEGDCFILRTNMATNLYFPWLLASIAEKNSLHFTHFGNTSISQESSSLAVKGYTGKMLEYFRNTLRFSPKIDANTLQLIKGRKTGGLNNNI